MNNIITRDKKCAILSLLLCGNGEDILVQKNDFKI